MLAIAEVLKVIQQRIVKPIAVPLAEFVGVWEQIGAVPVPQISDAIGEGVLLAPQERVPNRTLESTTEFPCASEHGGSCGSWACYTTGACTESCADQIVDLPVPLITEKIVADVFGLPQERVQNRATYTGKVFPVRHRRDDQACTVDNVEFIKGLDKHNMPRLGDVMVSAPQITKGIVGHVEQVVSWFDRKSQVAPDEPLYRFQTRRSGRSSRSKLKRS